MPENRDHFDNARNYASDHLRKMQRRTPEDVRKLAKIAAENEERTATILGAPIKIDVEALEAELRHLFSITPGSATVLDDHDPLRHVPWLPGKKGSIKWRFWNRYMTYLERDFGMAPTVVNNLHELTDMILERIEEPARDGPWDRRGMVVGSVQSGKTANYIGLINKAVDAGYKLVIVLAGIHSNLRAQTQLRVDDGVLGFDTKKTRKLNNESQWVGVGNVPGDRPIMHSLTSSYEKGDFSKKMAETIGVMLGGDPVVLVVKKNSRLLGNLITWFLHVAGAEDSETGERIVPNVPLLLIDDEADNASINVKDKQGRDVTKAEVSAINEKIRLILKAFAKSAYVGYTATPFANIFINPQAETPALGRDLFPASFIINVKPPSNYVGPAKVFGLDGDVDAGIPAQDGVDIVREIDDYAAPSAFPPRHKKGHVPTELPASLKRAIRCFILACAARRARGQGKKHNSMLVHVTRFVDVQNHVVRLVRDEVVALQRRIEFGDGNRTPTVRDELRDLWETEFVPVSESLGEDAGAPVLWEQVDAELHGATSKFAVLPINGFAKEALDYKEHEAEGRNVIAVGGDKLSRGLTLEGLSISYFLRTSRMYDTLMQMGRWFGYRPGYLDLCRLYTTSQLVDWYQHIALADVELRREFDYMVDSGQTPEQYGLRVRTHPGGMTVTAINKMCHSERRELKWPGLLVQTTVVPKDAARIAANLEATQSLIEAIGNPSLGKNLETKLWNGVSAKKVVAFVSALRFPPESARASGQQLADFINQQSSKLAPELTTWTVVLVSSENVEQRMQRTIAGIRIGLIRRTPESQTRETLTLPNSNFINPPDQSLDLALLPLDQAALDAVAEKSPIPSELEGLLPDPSKSLRDLALQITRSRIAAGRLKGDVTRNVPNGRVVREVRPKGHGLLLIYPLHPPSSISGSDGRPEEATGLEPDGQPILGVALSFPTSDTVLGVEYRVNRVWGAEMQEDDQYDNDN